MELREVIARAISDTIYEPDHTDPSGEPMWTHWEDEAQAALDAITEAGFVIVPREPTEAMRSAGWKDYKDVGDIWSAMIAAATEPRNIPESTQAD